MATQVKMPALGESITEGTIIRWLKQEGDHVDADEPLLEVSTDKVDTEIPSPVTGTLQRITAGEDQTVEVGAELAVVAEDESAGAAVSPAAGNGQPGNGQPERPAAETEQQQESASESEVQAAPAAEAPAVAEADEPAGAAAAEPAAEEAPADSSSGTEAPPAGGEATVVRMPALGESITEGTIIRWLKQEGDHVDADEPLLEVSTDKVDTEIPSPVTGTLQRITAGEDQTVEVGAELAVVAAGAAAGARAAAAPADSASPAAPQAPAAPAAASGPAAPAAPAAAARRGNGEAAVVSPLVRKLVREYGVDLGDVAGTGAGGRVRRQDVLAYISDRGEGDGGTAAAATPSAPAAPAARPSAPAAPAPAAGPQAIPVRAVPLPTGVREEISKTSRVRRIIAERMVSSLQVSAQLTVGVEIDMTAVMRLRERVKDDFKAREGVSLSPLPFAMAALIAAVREHPMANAALDADFNLHLYSDVNLGVAVDTPKGLFVPVIRQADRLNLTGLAHAVADVAKRTRDGKIDPSELSGSTITVTNTGSVGAVWDTPIINQPNACILATPAITRRPVVVDDPDLGEVIAVRHMMNGVLTYDHRILDGADAARFLGTVKRVLEAGDFSSQLGV